jgi:CheY-like chemotaxis protein
MPRLVGFQLAETLQRDERTNRIPFIILSGETAPASKARG